MVGLKRAGSRVSLLVADVDGTLVTDDKILAPRTEAAVASLRANGVAFAIVSSRPPRGLRMLIGPLRITTPLAGFNGGILTTPEYSTISQHILSPATARQTVELIDAHGAQTWVFRDDDWLARDAEGPYVEHEERAIAYRPTVVRDFGDLVDGAAKIVGVSADFDLLTRVEQDAHTALAERATVARSQPYYVDFTPPLADKGVALSELAKLLKRVSFGSNQGRHCEEPRRGDEAIQKWLYRTGLLPPRFARGRNDGSIRSESALTVPTTEVAAIGDGGNDIAMFGRSGLSIATGNASPEVQRAADFVTDRNSQDGFARAVEWFILHGNRSAFTPEAHPPAPVAEGNASSERLC